MVISSIDENVSSDAAKDFIELLSTDDLFSQSADNKDKFIEFVCGHYFNTWQYKINHYLDEKVEYKNLLTFIPIQDIYNCLSVEIKEKIIACYKDRDFYIELSFE
ncbi:hypothetical protein SAMN02745150_01305 [Brevinema andersonii]|uniref:Uncharacterized protein n=1 Tax=Brevinema andersonii TaxID=34097 RepID=A0A1I1EX76_BREAD|nr:hypothetical protein [Brevinema andersonii]SFB91577.1 hypothetical protein SAMN02745150_01305 [Brevinema andersonii]